MGGGSAWGLDDTNNGRHLRRYVGFYQVLEIRVKPREMVIFCDGNEKYHTNKHFAATRFTFIVEKS